MDSSLRLSDSFQPGRYSLTQDVTIEAQGGHHMTFDDSLRSSLGPVGDPMLVSTGRKIRRDAEESMTSSQMSVASASSLGILQLDSMGDLSNSLLQLDTSFNPPRFSNGFLDGQDGRQNNMNGEFEPGERGKATGVDSIPSSEIDTEDELEAVRRENAKRVLYPASPGTDRHGLHAGDGGESSDETDHSRPCLEGGSSDENDSTLPSSPQQMSLRQSAEGEVVGASPVPGDGGGGGDGMSDGETGSSLTAPSVVSGGIGGSRPDGGTRRVNFRSWSSQSGFSDHERNVEGSVLSDPQQTPTPEMSRLASHFLLPSAHTPSAGSATDQASSPEPRPLSTASSFRFEEALSSQEGLHQRFWNSGMLEGASAEAAGFDEDRRGNGTEEEEEEKEGEKTLTGALGGRWSASLAEFENMEAEINTEGDILQIQQMMSDFPEASSPGHSPRGAYNPFDVTKNGDQGNSFQDASFSAFDGDFFPADDAEVILEQDQQDFEKEHEFRQDEHISSSQFSHHNASEWTLPDKSHMTINRSDVEEDDEDCFDERVSLGAFMRTRTEALGSLGGDSGIQRPSFGTGRIKTPEGKEPFALIEMSRLSLVSEEQEGEATRAQGFLGLEDLGESIRFAGVGSDTEDKHTLYRTRNEAASQGVSQFAEDSSSSFAELDEYTPGRDSLPMASLYFRGANPEGSSSGDWQSGRGKLPRSDSDNPRMASLDLGDLYLADGDESVDDDSGGVSRFLKVRGDVGDETIAETPNASQISPRSSLPNPGLKEQPFQKGKPEPPRQVLHLRDESEPDGTRTPPIATSSIAAAIISASSCTKPEELAAMIVALSNKNRKLDSGAALQPGRKQTEKRLKPVDVHPEDTFPKQAQTFPKIQKNRYPDTPEPIMHEPNYLARVQKSLSSKTVSEGRPGSEDHGRRIQPSGTNSEPQKSRQDEVVSTHPVGYKSMQAQDMEAEEYKSHRSRSASRDSFNSAHSEKVRDSLPEEKEKYSKQPSRSPKMSGTAPKPDMEDPRRFTFENSVMKEIVGLEMSFDSRMKVHAERVQMMERAQEGEVNRTGHESSGDSDTLLGSPRLSGRTPQDIGQAKMKPETSREDTLEIDYRLSSDNQRDLKYRTGRRTEDSQVRLSPKNSKSRDRPLGSQRSSSEMLARNRKPEAENHEDLLTSSSDTFQEADNKQRPPRSPNNREASVFKGTQTAGFTRSDLVDSQSPGRTLHGSRRDGRHDKKVLMRDNAHRRNYSSDEEDDDGSPRKRQSWNDHKSNLHMSKKNWNHEGDNLDQANAKTADFNSRNGLDNQRTHQTAAKTAPAQSTKQAENSKVKTNDHGRSRKNLKPDRDIRLSPGMDRGRSASPRTSPMAKKSSLSPCSASSSLSETATQTSEDDTRKSLPVKSSAPSTSLSLGPPITSFQAFPSGPHVSSGMSSTTPTLLTSQSLLTDALLKQYLNEQAVTTSRPPNALSVAPSYISGQLMRSLDAVQRGAALAPPLISPSAVDLGPQTSTLGLAQALTINTAENVATSTLNQLPSLNPPYPTNTIAAAHPILSSTHNLGPMLDRVSMHSQGSRLESGMASYPPYPTSATMPVMPQQVAHTAPPSMSGLTSLTVSSYAGLPNLQGAGLPAYPVTAMSRPGTAQGHGPPQPTRLSSHGINPVVVSSVNIKGVCCLGIARHALLPLQNPGPRWLQCHLEVASVSVNGEELPPHSLSSFLVKRRTIISPHNTEEVKVVFVPHQPGIYVAQVLVSCSPVVAEGEVAYLNQGVPVTILARAEKPNIGIKGAQNGTLDLGVLSYGKERSAPLYLVNKGLSTVPLRLLIKTNSTAWHSFFLHSGDTRSCPDGSVASGLNLPTHLTLESQNDTAPLWVHFRAAPRDKASSPNSLGGGGSSAPEQVLAKLEVWLDVPDGGKPITSVAVRATVGLAKLNTPRSLTKEISLRSKQGEHTSCMLPLKNTGTIHLDMELTVVSSGDLFSIVPRTILLAPSQEVDVLIKYSPKKVPSSDTGQLTMCARPDGPSYEVTLRGEAVEKSLVTAKPNFLVNRHFISWGGVPIGRALQQKLTIRSCCKTEVLKLKLYFSGNKVDFQLLSSFKTGEWSTDDSQYVSLQPLDDLPIHILFSPTAVATSQAKLNIKPQGSNFKYTIPLSGYGGVSKLIVEDLHETEHGCYGVDIGQILGERRVVRTVTLRNAGRRSAFVKALGFRDEQGREKLPSSQLQIDPPDFILPKGSRKVLTVTLNIDQQLTDDKPGARDGLLAAVGLFYGDEISRQQHRRALRHKESESVSLSEHNPLRGISFDQPIPGEANVNEVYDLPWRSGDLNLFYRCVSRIMLLLNGRRPILGDPTAATKFQGTSLQPLGSSKGDSRWAESQLEVGQHSNRPVTVPTTPPVKGTPAPRPSGPSLRALSAQPQVGASALPYRAPPEAVMPVLPSSVYLSNLQGKSSSNSGEESSWSVNPQHLVLTAPGAGAGVQKSHSIRIANLTVRKLRFETMHTPDCLIVTPAAGMVEPMRHLLVLVSCNPSIQAKGVQLPWSGAILVVCDGKKQEVRVQIREDLGMDTSIVPSSGRMQSLPNRPATPDKSVVATQAEITSPVKLLSKVVRFPGTDIGCTSEATIEFQNKMSEPRRWCLSSFAPTYVKQDTGDVYRATYSAFRFTHTFGNLEPGQNVAVQLEFIPRDVGDYSQYWDLESSDKSTMAKGSHKTRIELMGQGVRREDPPLVPASKRPKKKKKKQSESPEDTLVRVKPLIHPKHAGVSQPGLADNASEGDVSPEDARTQEKKAGQSPDSKSAHGIVLIHEHLVFNETRVGSKSTLKVQVQNTSKEMHTLKFVRPQEPFFISHHQHDVQPNRYIRLPVAFKPKAPGKHQAALVIQTEGHHSLLTRLEGVAV